MQAVTTIGLDIAKLVFQVHGVDATGQVVVRRRLKPEQPVTSRPMGRKFFISFNTADRTKAHWIAWTLKEAGHEVAVHDWEMPAGP